MARDEKISLFFRQFTQEQRIIIDYLSGLIFEHFPTIKETIGEEVLKYTSTGLGSLFIITVKEEKVRFYFKKKKINKNHTFNEGKTYYYIYYGTLKKVDREILINIFNQYLNLKN